MKSLPRLYLIIGAAAFVVLILAYFLWPQNKTSALQTTPVTKGNLRVTVEATATVTPENKLEIMPPIAGRAESVEVDMGAKVKQGQVLAWMSSTERAALLDAARAKGAEELKFWQDVYKPAPLVAPLDGTIISRTLVPGQVVQSTTVVFVMSDRLIIEADLDETDLGKIALEQSADVTLDGFPEARLHGKVYKIAFAATTVNNVNTYKVDVLLDHIPEYMRSGMTANVSFLIAERKDVLLVPAAAVQNNEVFILPAGKKKSEARSVKLGLSDGRLTEVISGVSEGEPIVTNSYQLPQAPSSTGFSLTPRMPRRGATGGGGPR